MTEYYLIRIALSIGLLFLLRIELPSALRRYVIFLAFYQAAPQYLTDGHWWRFVWLPWSLIQIGLGWFVCCEIFDIQTRYRTLWSERVSVKLLGACLGVALALLSWRWRPENTFQGWTVIHQYYRIALFFGWVAVSIWFGWVRPLLPRDSDLLAKFWTVWLGCQAVMGATARAGLVWVILPATVRNYRLVNDCGMMIQFFSVVYLCLKGKYARRKQSGTYSSAH